MGVDILFKIRHNLDVSSPENLAADIQRKLGGRVVLQSYYHSEEELIAEWNKSYKINLKPTKKARHTKTTKVLFDEYELEKTILLTHGENAEKIIFESDDPDKNFILANLKRYKKRGNVYRLEDYGSPFISSDSSRKSYNFWVGKETLSAYIPIDYRWSILDSIFSLEDDYLEQHWQALQESREKLFHFIKPLVKELPVYYHADQDNFGNLNSVYTIKEMNQIIKRNKFEIANVSDLILHPKKTIYESYKTIYLDDFHDLTLPKETLNLAKANRMLVQAFNSVDETMLKKALDMGADINFRENENDESLIAEMLFEYGYDQTQRIYKNAPCSDCEYAKEEDRYLNFLQICVDHQIDLNTFIYNFERKLFSAFTILKYSKSKRIVEFLLRHGMDLNVFSTPNISLYDEIYNDIYDEEMCSNGIMSSWLFDVSRLMVAFGAKPSTLLLDSKLTTEKKRLFSIVMSLDTEKIAILTSDEIKQNELDYALTEYSKFAFPDEFYYHSDTFQKRMIKALAVIIDIIGIKNVSNELLNNCVEQQFVQVLDFLLQQGADPNVNCFTESYKHIASSALYSVREYEYILPENKQQMEKCLVDAGATIDKRQ